MRVEVSPSSAVASGGQPVLFSVMVVNTAPIISSHRISVLGVDPAWVQVEGGDLSLFPDAVGVATVTVTLPPGIPAGIRRIGISVEEVTAPTSTTVLEVDLTVPLVTGARLELQPASVTGGRTAEVGLVVGNDGNATIDLALAGVDEEEAVRFAFDPPVATLAPGERVTVAAELAARRPFAGSPKVRAYTVELRSRDEEVLASSVGTFVQKPLLTRGALALVGLLAAVTVFALVITSTLGNVVNSSQADRDLLIEALRGDDGGGGLTNPSSVAGTVTLLTSGAPVAGVTVEAYAASDLTQSVASGATGDDGAYTLGELPEGTYKIRFQGSGFTELWFPQSLGPDQAGEVEVAAGAAVDAVDVRLGGVPATVEGIVTTEDEAGPAGASVVLRLPAAASPAGTTGTLPGTTAVDPATTPAVTSIAVDATGEFSLEDVPSPSIYELSVTKEGFATETQLISIGAGEARDGVQVQLRRGDGSISGQVFSDSGPLGGAEVTASDGRTTVRTASLTTGDVGSFTLRELPTPASYTVVISRDGFVTETLNVTLGAVEQRTGVVATLGDGAGTISGRVTVVGGGPAGGVTVRATDGETVVETVSRSTGDIGTYRLSGLLLPGTYTVTFERPDLAPQTRSVDLDPVGVPDAIGVDAALRPSTATLTGTVSEGRPGQPAVPLGEVQIILTSGERRFETVSASQPAGRYEVRGIPPGTYSVSFQRSGSIASASLVTLEAGAVRTLDATLAPRASIQGTVRVPGGAPLPGAGVRLFLVSQYPQTVLATTTTGADGTYLFPDLEAPEQYLLEFTVVPGGAPECTDTIVLGASEAGVVDYTAGTCPGPPPQDSG